MAGGRILFLLLWMCFQCSDGKEALSKREVHDTTHLRTSQPYPKEPGFLSRIASWIFPFQDNAVDSLPSSNHQPKPQYLPPPVIPTSPIYQSPPSQNFPQPKYLPPNSHPPKSDCNPCNKEPWIPIIGKSAKNTVIQFVPPHQVNNNLDGLNPPPQHYGPPNNQPPAADYYGPPPNQYGPPKVHTPSHQYDAPKNPNTQYGAPSNHYAPIPPSIHPRPPNSYGPPAPQFRTKPFPTNSHQGVPSVRHNNYVDIIGMRAPPLPTTHLDPVRSKAPNNIQDIIQPPVSQHSVLDEDFPPYTKKPIDSYNSPNIQGIEQIPLSSGDNDDFRHPIAFPNLSVRPLAPIHNFVNFHQVPGKLHSVEVLPSVPIADFVSSIEHPINVIQSPIVDLSVKNEPEETTQHPIYVPTQRNTIQSGLFVNPNVNTEKLHENPIVVDDSHASASSHNETYNLSDQLKKNNIANTQTFQSLPLSGRENDDDDIGFSQNWKQNTIDNKQNTAKDFKFTQPPMDYSQWTPTWGGLAMEISPPPLQSTWLKPISTEPPKTKHVQIIIPYYNFNQTSSEAWNTGNTGFKIPNEVKSYTTLLPVYKPPPSSEQSVWSQFLNDLSASSSQVGATAFRPATTTQVYNIQDLLGSRIENYNMVQSLPFDVLSFQKNIDEWTQQAYAKTTEKLSSRQGVIQRLNPSKNIPEEYFTTVPYDYTTKTSVSNYLNDHEAAGSMRKENFRDVDNNLVLDDITSTTEDTSTIPTTTESDSSLNETKSPSFTAKTQKSLWDTVQATMKTHEKVYIVTPASPKIGTASPIAWSLPPKVEAGTITVDKNLLYEHPKFSIRIEQNGTKVDGNNSSTTKVIFSEWPHKINNLQTTTIKPTSRHPLFGLMDVSAYSPPDNQKIETVNGHSRVLQTTTISFKKRKRSE